MASRYCVGTPLSSTAAWAATDGGASGVSVPTAADDVKFTALSPSATLDALSCLTLDCTGYTNTLTWNAAVTITVAGTVCKFVAGMTLSVGSATTSVLLFSATSGTVTFTTGGKVLGSYTVGNGASTATVTLADANSVSATSTVKLVFGSFTTNNQTCSWGLFDGTANNTKSLTLGTSAITLIGAGVAWNIGNPAGMTFSGASSTLNFTAAGQTFQDFGVGRPYGTLSFTGSGAANVSLSGGCVTFTRTGTAVKTDSLVLGGGLNVSGTLTLTSNSSINPLGLNSSVVGTARTVTAAVLIASGRVDFQDITGAGAATWTTAASGATYFGDALGNAGITMTAGVTVFGVVAGNFSATATWSTSSGGAGSTTRPPLPQDNVVLDANSAAGTYACDFPRMCTNLTCTGFTRTLSTTVAAGPQIFGSITLGAGMTNAAQAILAGRSALTITHNGIHWANAMTLFAPGGTYTIQDDFNCGSATFGMTAGTLAGNGHNLTMGALTRAGTVALTLQMGSGTWTLTGTATVWSMAAAGTTITPGTSTIVLTDTSVTTKTFAGAGLTYNNLTLTGGKATSVILTGANTFNTLTVGQGVLVTLPAATTTAIAHLSTTNAGYGYQYLPGAAGQYVSTPDAAAVEVTGNITIDVCLAPSSWFTAQTFLSKYAASNHSYSLGVNASGQFLMTVSANGTADTVLTSAAVTGGIGFNAATQHWVRASLVLSNGANSVCQFFYSADGVTWTQLGTNVTGAIVASIFNGTAPLEVGSSTGGTVGVGVASWYEAKVYASALGSGAGTAVFDANFAAKATASNTFAESSTNAATVTINGATCRVGDGRVQFISGTPGTQATLSCSNQVAGNWFSLTDINAAGTTPFLAGHASVSVSNNTNWSLTAAPVLHTYAPTQAQALAVARQVSRPISLSGAQALVVSRAVARALALTGTGSVGVGRAVARGRTVAPAQAQALTVQRAVSRTVAAAQIDALAIARSVVRAPVAVTQGDALTVVRGVMLARAAAGMSAVSVVRAVSRGVAASCGTALVVTRALAVARGATATGSLGLARAVSRSYSVSAAPAVTTMRGVTATRRASASGALSTGRSVSRGLASSQTSASVVRRAVVATVVRSQASSLTRSASISRPLSMSVAPASSATVDLAVRGMVAQGGAVSVSRTLVAMRAAQQGQASRSAAAIARSLTAGQMQASAVGVAVRLTRGAAQGSMVLVGRSRRIAGIRTGIVSSEGYTGRVARTSYGELRV